MTDKNNDSTLDKTLIKIEKYVDETIEERGWEIKEGMVIRGGILILVGGVTTLSLWSILMGYAFLDEVRAEMSGVTFWVMIAIALPIMLLVGRVTLGTLVWAIIWPFKTLDNSDLDQTNWRIYRGITGGIIGAIFGGIFGVIGFEMANLDIIGFITWEIFLTIVVAIAAMVDKKK